MNTQEYYNAKPSKISNIGKDVSGARRMHFDTYETVEERQAKEVRKAKDKNIASLKENLKAEVLSASPKVETILLLKAEIFALEYNLNPNSDLARTIIMKLRAEINSDESRKAFNKLVSAFNKFKNESHRLAYSPSRYIAKMAQKYTPKKSFTEKSGQSYNWNQFKITESAPTVVNFLAHNTNAVQFGNSVTDNERAYICSELSDFIARWRTDTRFNRVSLMPINWSFGARGKAGSVAYYQSLNKVISVNRNNIGSLIHEIGHFIDDVAGHVSSKISYATVSRYRDSIKEGLDSKSLNYYCKRSEIFARAFEAYCYSIDAGFEPFAQCGADYLPQLDEELIGLIEEALKLS